MDKQLEQTIASLDRIQKFDAHSLTREKDFPTSNFATLVEPAEKQLTLFRLVPISILKDFPAGNLQQIQATADALYSYLKPVLDFNMETGTIASTRAQALGQLVDTYASVWSTLSPYISYAAARTSDVKRLEREATQAIKDINEKTAGLLLELNTTKAQANEALAAAQKAAAEQGVSQHASYFKLEADSHDAEAGKWQKSTRNWAIGLMVYAAATLLLHVFDFFNPKTGPEASQLITGKILIFAVLSFMLILSARNFLSHKHNAIVNRHRQNALLTFNALVTAAKDEAAKDIILSHAASCIFAPQETGYAKGAAAPEGSLGQAMVGLLAKSETRQ